MANPPVAVKYIVAGEVFNSGLSDLSITDNLRCGKPSRPASVGAIFVLVSTATEGGTARGAADFVGLAVVFVVRF